MANYFLSKIENHVGITNRYWKGNFYVKSQASKIKWISKTE